MGSTADQSSKTTTAQTTLVVRAEPVVTDIARVNVPVAASPAPAQGSGEMMHMLMMLHRSLRGHYLLAIVLALVGGAVGAVGMAKFRKPQFHSEALIRIAYTLPEVMGPTDQNKPMDQFDSFMVSQKVLLTSQGIIPLVVDQPVWKNTQLSPDDANRYFTEHLDVDIRPRSEFILIKVTDEIPGRASAAVNALVTAYQGQYKAMTDPLQSAREGFLQDQKEKFNRTLIDAQSAITENPLVKQYGMTDLGPLCENALQRVTKLQDAIAEVKLALTAAPSEPPTTNPALEAPPKKSVPPVELTAEQIAIHDPEMAHRVDEARKAESEVRHLQSMLGEKHRLVQAAEVDLTEAQRQVDEYLTFCREYQNITGQDLGDSKAGPAATAGKTIEQLQHQKTELENLCKTETTEMQKLGKERLAIQGKQAEVVAAREELDRLVRRIELLDGEQKVGPRLTVISSGSQAAAPDHDARLKLIALAGLCGMAFPVAAVAGLGFMRRRYKYSDEPEADVASLMPLLGILPNLDNGDDEDRAAAAHSVHQIRVALQSRAGSGRSLVYLVTSSTGGEGKTSFTTALALSFAVSGLRTLIIDCDLVGRSLSGAMEGEKVPGLAEAIQDGNIKKYVRKITSDLYVLPSGAVESSHASALVASKLSILLNDARRYFNVILVDTGPILGSLEAAVTAPLADATVMVIARGQARGLVRHALQKLRSLNASAIGFIYNRASLRDFSSSPYGSSSSGATISRLRQDEGTSVEHEAGDAARAERLQKLRALGPLVAAVDSSVPWKEELSVAGAS